MASRKKGILPGRTLAAVYFACVALYGIGMAASLLWCRSNFEVCYEMAIPPLVYSFIPVVVGLVLLVADSFKRGDFDDL